MENKYAFISYKSDDFDEACWVKKVLVENGISCWMAPDSIPGGSSYADEIDDAINNCTVFVLVLSEKAQQSKWVKKELDRAINTGKLVLPFMIENIQLEKAFNFYLTDVQRYSAFESKVAAVEKMVKHIQAAVGVTTSKPVDIAPAPVSVKTEQTNSSGNKDEDLSFEGLYKDIKDAVDKMKKGKVMSYVLKYSPYNKAEAGDSKVRYALDMASAGWLIASVLNILPMIFFNFFAFIISIVATFFVWNGLFFICKKVAKIENNYKILAPIICGVSAFLITQFVLGLILVIF